MRRSLLLLYLLDLRWRIFEAILLTSLIINVSLNFEVTQIWNAHSLDEVEIAQSIQPAPLTLIHHYPVFVNWSVCPEKVHDVPWFEKLARLTKKVAINHGWVVCHETLMQRLFVLQFFGGVFCQNYHFYVNVFSLWSQFNQRMRTLFLAKFSQRCDMLQLNRTLCHFIIFQITNY